MVEPVRISRRRARQLAVMGQLLDAPRRRTIEEVVAGLGEVQIDPTSVVARTEHLVLFSRLGTRFKVADLERLLWQDRALFEYWVHILPIADLPVHRISMRRYPHGPWKRHRYVREWLVANRDFERYVLGELRRRGPLRARDLENRAAEGWRTGGWNDEGQSVPMLLDILWFQGKVMIAGRDGQQRIWDLASRSLPKVPSRSRSQIAAEVVDRDLRTRGFGRLERIGWLFDGETSRGAIARSQRRLARGTCRARGGRRRIDGRLVAHRDLLDTAFRGRTVALSPFDDLVSDRDSLGTALRHVPPDRDLRAEDQAAVGVLRAAGAARRPAGGPVRPGLRPDGEHPARHAIHMQEDTDAGRPRGRPEAIDDLARWLRVDRVVLPRRVG